MGLQKPIGDFRSHDMTPEANMQLNEQKSGCRSQYVAAGADIQLHEPIYANRSQDVTAEAMMWLQ